jgi:hypothetical protein
MREFTMAAQRADEVAELLPGARPLEFKMLGRTMTATPPSNTGPVAYLMAMQSSDADESDQAFAVVRFFSSLLGQKDGRRVRAALATGEIDLDTLMEVFAYLMQEWSARPTGPPPG